MVNIIFILFSIKLIASPQQIRAEVGDFNWCILDDNVYIINDFIHPGGNFIIDNIKGSLYCKMLIKSNLGREIGRFIYGAYGLEVIGDNSKHLHSPYAIGLLQKYFVGKALNEYQIFKYG